jgi:hypothetical protein
MRIRHANHFAFAFQRTSKTILYSSSKVENYFQKPSLSSKSLTFNNLGSKKTTSSPNYFQNCFIFELLLSLLPSKLLRFRTTSLISFPSLTHKKPLSFPPLALSVPTSLPSPPIRKTTGHFLSLGHKATLLLRIDLQSNSPFLICQ